MMPSRTSGNDCSSINPKTQPATVAVAAKKESVWPLSLPSSKTPRNSSNRLWIQEERRRTFLQHLTRWSLNHDSCPYFQGKISLLPRSSTAGETVELGKSVQCILTDTAFTDTRQKIVIRLFLPHMDATKHRASSAPQKRRDSMDLFSSGSSWGLSQEHSSDSTNNNSGNKMDQISPANGHYTLVVRCGAGWMSARDYFSKVYFSHMEAQRAFNPGEHSRNDVLTKRSQLLGDPPSDKDSVTVRPLFHPFQRLPPELQDMVLSTAASLSRSYSLCSDENGIPKIKKKQNNSPISLSTLFRISKTMNEHLVPHIYHSTDFEFGLTGFTSFLWHNGPSNRLQIRRLTFHFGKMALLHCIRWLTPDPIFDLFEPPVATSPRTLQYFWRCQIRDLARELHLLTLTIDIKSIVTRDIPMVVAILRSVFGSIERVRFVDTGKDGVNKVVEAHDERLIELGKGTTWRELCMGYYRRHRRHSFFFKFELLRGEEQDLESIMDCNKEFFDGVLD